MIKVDRKALEKALKRASETIDTRLNESYLQFVLVEPQDSFIKLTATDLEQGITVKIPVLNGELRQKFCTSCRKFYEVIKSLDEEDTVELELKERLIVKSEDGSSVFELGISSAEEFPSLPDFQTIEYVSFPGNIFASLVEKTSFSTLKGKNRYMVFSGILFEFLKDEGRIRAVSTDGHRLSLFDIDWTEEKEMIGKVLGDKGMIIEKEQAEIIAEIGEEEGIFQIGRTNGFVVVEWADGLYFTRLIEGDFPDYRVIIPQEFNSTLWIKRDVLESAVKKVITVEDQKKFQPVKIQLFSTLWGEVRFSSVETETGKAEVKCHAKYEGEDVEIVLNAEYLLSVLKVMDSDEVEIKIIDRQKPIMIREKESNNFLYLVMPMAV